MDHAFLKRAQRITSFNLDARDFQSTQYKKEIQFLFVSHLFPKFKTETIKGTRISKSDLNRVIKALKSAGKIKDIHRYKLSGVGPGEVMLYFCVDKAHLGGGSSAGMDLAIGSGGYEIKACKPTGGFFTDYKLGGTVDLDPFKARLNTLRQEYGVGGSATEISGSRMEKLKKEAPYEYEEIENDFRKEAYNKYFKNHETIFINNTDGGQMGLIEDIRKVREKDIFMERVTSGTLKPKVKI